LNIKKKSAYFKFLLLVLVVFYSFAYVIIFQIFDILLSYLVSVPCTPHDLPPCGMASSFVITAVDLLQDCSVTVTLIRNQSRVLTSTGHRGPRSPPGSVVSRIYCGFFPNVLESRTLLKVAGTFPILYGFSYLLLVALRLHLQIPFILWNIISLDLGV
jgi:hypothetical protein